MPYLPPAGAEQIVVRLADCGLDHAALTERRMSDAKSGMFGRIFMSLTAQEDDLFSEGLTFGFVGNEEMAGPRP
ncbi:hypothetical protein [Novosphingobium mangrovi (ex Huang et al. 2023)]|uniref:Uncharacterized protein n=1 Tax=Novosphingobium mangrovi (ex Huang et al. 2023) TaxID=2976432 RepID=A0ABT2I3G5_9SPHN|nr:hypothetical protein [Novosphingobium mangrovi (ex Huang et al. 2023)]MCT2399344.1 hypothetical protein [Novosphingobium mangrovi (ex Huang et al. 2023)]